MTDLEHGTLEDTGERMIPPAPGEISFVWERHRFAYSYAASLASGKRVLDVGCGTGYGADLLAQTASSVLAVDNSPSAIDYCRQHYSRPNLEYRVEDASSLSLDAQFDLVISFQVIEHLPGPEDFLRRLKDHTAPGGVVVVTTPNVRNPEPTSGNPFHVSEMNRRQMQTLAQAVFPAFDVRGIGYARPNLLRRMIQRTPLYVLGRLLKRSSVVKKAADRALDLRRFQILDEHIDRDALDLLLIAQVTESASLPK